MARRPKRQIRVFNELLARLEPQLRAAFMAAVQDLHSGADYSAMLRALEVGDIEAAIAALNIEPAAFYRLGQAQIAAYAEAGAAAMPLIHPAGTGGIGIRWDMVNPRAERWIAENVAANIADLTEQARSVVRQTILAGFQAGDHPKRTALNLAGRVVNGQRQGGVLGLDSGRAHRLNAVTRGMETPAGVRSLVTRHRDGKLSVNYKVNKATEARILRAYRNGTAVPEADRRISEQQLSNELLKDRAEMIAGMETASAVMGAREESMRQTMEKLGLPPEAALKTWRHGRGAAKRHRPDHYAMGGKTVRGIDATFDFPDGTRMKFAHDPNGGPKHNAHCGCMTDFRVDHTLGLE